MTNVILWTNQGGCSQGRELNWVLGPGGDPPPHPKAMGPGPRASAEDTRRAILQSVDVSSEQLSEPPSRGVLSDLTVPLSLIPPLMTTRPGPLSITLSSPESHGQGLATFPVLDPTTQLRHSHMSWVSPQDSVELAGPDLHYTQGHYHPNNRTYPLREGPEVRPPKLCTEKGTTRPLCSGSLRGVSTQNPKFSSSEGRLGPSWH